MQRFAIARKNVDLYQKVCAFGHPFDALRSGGLQRAWIATAPGRRANMFVFVLPPRMLTDIAALFAAPPMTSANAKLLFFAHAQLHTRARMLLRKPSVNAQLQPHIFPKLVPTVRQKLPTFLSNGRRQAMLRLCFLWSAWLCLFLFALRRNACVCFNAAGVLRRLCAALRRQNNNCAQ